MAEELIRHLQKHIAADAEDARQIVPFFRTVPLQKKEALLAEGQLCRYHYFVAKGCLRMYFVNGKGMEQTIHFAIENWWITDYPAFQHRAAASFHIQAIEPSEVLAIDYASQEDLFREFPQMERYFRLIFQRAYSAAQLRIRYLYDFSREEFYDHFSTHFPEFIQRVPQYLLASYLNMTPEYLSEIRSKKRS
ncbi:MAG TPA: Crp/Fnr family transcriptional regulator [Chitinophagaceae bacterium]|jgi:CRP-like cAMP-binding protein|nr:Crp/Fnr family transcriptional regulator [Chitinophagaceae bacterium]